MDTLLIIILQAVALSLTCCCASTESKWIKGSFSIMYQTCLSSRPNKPGLYGCLDAIKVEQADQETVVADFERGASLTKVPEKKW